MCSVIKVEEGHILQCKDTEPFLIRDGIDNDGVELEIIDPCGDDPSIQYEEVLLKFGKTIILAYFKQGDKEFLIQLPPGNYVTTDNQKCKFNVVDVDGEYLVIDNI